MKVVVVNGKEFKLPKRYQDKRAVEKLIRKAREAKKSTSKAPKKRIKELQIPFKLDHRTTVYIRESKFLTPKWLKYFDSIEDAQKYIDYYKLDHK